MTEHLGYERFELRQQQREQPGRTTEKTVLPGTGARSSRSPGTATGPSSRSSSPSTGNGCRCSTNKPGDQGGTGEVREWQNRPLESSYAIVYLDALRIKGQDGKSCMKSVHVALGTADRIGNSAVPLA